MARRWLVATALLTWLLHHGPAAVGAIGRTDPVEMAVRPEPVPRSSEGGIASPPVNSSAPEALGWETVALSGATCGRGGPFKYFVNQPAGEPDGLYLYLMGGGACMLEGLPPAGTSGPAAQVHCMAYSNFVEPTDQYHFAGLLMPFLRREASNPFANWLWAFVPYCTGDLHAGTMTEPYDYDPSAGAEFDVVHRGRLNVMAVLADLSGRAPPNMSVVLTGSSAGGLGAIYSFPAVQELWPRTVLIPDAGIVPPVARGRMVTEGPRIASRWGSRALLPSYCPTDDCLSDSLRLLDAHAEWFDGEDGPWLPFGYLQGQRDATLAAYLGVDGCGYEMGLRAAVEAAAAPNLTAYLPATEEHTFLARSAGYESALGVKMTEWFAAVAMAERPGDNPVDAADPWLPCNPLHLPRLTLAPG